MKIWSHTLFKNEEKWLWYSVMSVINHVDRVLLWDTGSTDASLKIAKEIKRLYSDKVDLKEIGDVDAESFSDIRSKMLKETKADWFLMVDADEVWWEDSIKKVVKTISDKGNEMESVVVPLINVVGDIFHYQEEEAGRYTLAGKKGHLALRGINRSIPGLSSKNPHGTWGWTDEKGKMIQDRDAKKIKYIDASYLHATHLSRGGSITDDEKVMKRKMKLKYELGKKAPLDQYFPEVFFRERPKFVPSPWQVMNREFYLRALVETPLRKIKRRIWEGGVGY